MEARERHYLVNGSGEQPQPREALEWAGQTQAQMVDLKFCDLLGAWQHMTMPLRALDAIAQHAAERNQEHERRRLDGSHDRKRGRHVPKVVDLPGDGDEEDAVADQRHRLPRPKDGEVADLQRFEKLEVQRAPSGVENRKGVPPPRAPTGCCSQTGRSIWLDDTPRRFAPARLTWGRERF